MDNRIPARALIECILCSKCGQYATATGGGICAACALTTHRDQLRLLYDTARAGMRELGDSLETCRIEKAEATQERDRLAGEVERLRGEVGKRDVALSATTAAVRDDAKNRWKGSIDAATARATTAESQLAHWKNQHDIELLSADGLAAQVALLKGALEKARRTLKWHGFTYQASICDAALATTPAAALGRVKAEALRAAVDEIRNDEAALESAATARGALLCIADRLEKEATNGR